MSITDDRNGDGNGATPDTVEGRADVEDGSTGGDESPMTVAEFGELGKLEAEISDCWCVMAWAFGEIRERRLYRQTPDGERQTWEEYCKRKYDKSKQYVDRLIRAAGVVAKLRAETIVSELPATPSQATELVGLASDEMAVAATAAQATAKAEGRKPTAEDYRTAARSTKAKRASRPKDTGEDSPTDGGATSGPPGRPADDGRAGVETIPLTTPHMAKLYSLKITVQSPEDRQAVSNVLRELDVQFITKQYPNMTKLVASPLATKLGRLLTRLGGWLEENQPPSFAIQVGDKPG